MLSAIVLQVDGQLGEYFGFGCDNRISDTCEVALIRFGSGVG
jgi:hypothetical protein